MYKYSVYQASGVYKTCRHLQCIKYAADKAVEASGERERYYCSEQNAGLPVFWWLSFGDRRMKIVSIQFEEKYKGAEFEFFACDMKEFCKEGRVLINGTQKEINGKDFDNGQYYPCYGLKITKLGAYQYASLMKFQYFVRGKLYLLILLLFEQSAHFKHF